MIPASLGITKKEIVNWPGENLIIKMWESIADKGVGSLLKPWQLRREGSAQLDVRRKEIVVLAAAEKEADEIRAGRRKLRDSRHALSLTAPVDAEAPTGADSRLDRFPIQVAADSVVADALRKEVNVAKAVVHAENELRDDTAAPSNKQIEPDWLYRWRDYAGQVSSDELQAIWGKILAGESKSPGCYSFRLMDFVRNLTKEEALLIERVSPFVIKDFIPKGPDDVLEKENLRFQTFLELQELGLISSADSFTSQIEIKSLRKEKFVSLLRCHNLGLMVVHPDPKKEYQMPAFFVTTLGVQVMNLGKFKANENFLKAVGVEIKKAGFAVTLVEIFDESDGKRRWADRAVL